jgi:hypothetical protein
MLKTRPCPDCGATDRHPYRECDPQLLAEHQAWEARILERQVRAEKAAQELLEELQIRGIPARLGWDCRYKVEISGLDLIAAKNERST